MSEIKDLVKIDFTRPIYLYCQTTKSTKGFLKIKEAIQKLIKSGTIIVMTSQTIFGRVDLNVYSKGRELLDLGIIPGEDMLAETALIKLSWLLANFDKKEIPELIMINLRGEINPRLIVDKEFI